MKPFRCLLATIYLDYRTDPFSPLMQSTTTENRVHLSFSFQKNHISELRQYVSRPALPGPTGISADMWKQCRPTSRSLFVSWLATSPVLPAVRRRHIHDRPRTHQPGRRPYGFLKHTDSCESLLPAVHGHPTRAPRFV